MKILRTKGKYVANEDNKSDPAPETKKSFKKARRDARYQVPDFYRKYITLRIKSGETMADAKLFNFSRHGLMFHSAVPFGAGSLMECAISAPQFLTKDISFSFRVVYCLPKEGSYEIGAEIQAVADATWFDILTEVHDFIIARKGAVY